MPHEIYSPLDPQSSCIRVVHLLPGEFPDPIVCNLETIQFSDNSRYEALSYVWGDAGNKLPIKLCGQTAWATTNLELALRHLRLPNTLRVLWIDALCINQNDTAERNSQVRLMRNIYQNAIEVLIWLGNEPVNFSVRSFLDTMTPFSKDASIHWIKENFEELERVVQFVLTDISAFFKIPWWSRIWTVQEYVLAKHTTFFLGSHSFPGSLLRGLTISFMEHSACCFNGDIGDSLVVSDQLAADMDQLRDLLSLQETKNSLDLLQILVKFRNRDATEPVDKIFGLLGLIEIHNEELVNYSTPPGKVFEETAIRIIESTGNLDVFGQTSPSRERSSFKALPTWAPDWCHENSIYVSNSRNMRYHCLALFHASKDAKVQMLRSEAKTLILKGLAVDLVEEV